MITMSTVRMFLLLCIYIGVLAAHNVDGRSLYEQETTVTGGVQCSDLLCISGVVNGSTVQYVLQSTGKYSLGWMAMGFGVSMLDSPMVIMWPNSDGSITLSQRQASDRIMPMVVSNPPRVATLSTSLSSTSGTQPKLAYTVPANSDTQQNIIWAFSLERPSSSDPTATLQKHLESGPLVLDLGGTLDSSHAESPAESSSAPSPTSAPSTSAPLTKYQKLIIAHAICCTVGFLLFLPAGALLARYLRTFSPTWFRGHWILQFVLGGSVIVSGVTCALVAVTVEGTGHLNDVHKKWGVAIFVLYFAQVALGAFIHWVKPKNRRGRPPQNYLHAVIGLLVISLALYQVHSGYSHEWPVLSGRRPLPKGVNILWIVWTVLLPVLYAAGLALLPRQFSQERQKVLPQRPDAASLPSDQHRD